MKVELNILNKKLELIQWLSTIEDSSIIEKINDLRKKESSDWWNSISENEKKSILSPVSLFLIQALVQLL